MLARVMVANEWQPIETAKSGFTDETVLVASVGRVRVAWRDSDNHWIDALSGDWADRVEPEPTHWMPLPVPPAE